ARAAGLDALLLDRGGLCASIAEWPIYCRFFTTRDKLEIADVPFAIPDDKPDRRQALVYYQHVARHHGLRIATHERVRGAQPIPADAPDARAGARLVVESAGRDGRPQCRYARAVALATGYWGQPKRLGVPGEDQPWIQQRYREPYGHAGEHVAIVGGGNTAAEVALDLWRNGVRVTIVHRRDALKPSIKYWLTPDIHNRIAEGSIDARMNTVVRRFGDDRTLHLATADGGDAGALRVDAAYVLIGYRPDVDLQRACGVAIDDETLEPTFDPGTFESNVPGLYVAGALQAGRRTDRIFIENSRDHGDVIVRHLLRDRAPAAVAASSIAR
ncbi:MAG: NAD(P)-binding domain-containing protein, partial [Acidobacteriota bacterium]